jgi:hypothetical protein
VQRRKIGDRANDVALSVLANDGASAGEHGNALTAGTDKRILYFLGDATAEHPLVTFEILLAQLRKIFLFRASKEFADRAPDHFCISAVGKEQPMVGTTHIRGDRILFEHGLEKGDGGQRRGSLNLRIGRKRALVNKAEDVDPIVLVKKPFNPQHVRRSARQGSQAEFLLLAEHQNTPLVIVAKTIQIRAQDFTIAAADEALRRQIMQPRKGSIHGDIAQLAVLHVGRQIERGNLVAD